MKEIRVHGRGGQGNVAAAELLGQAAFTDGKFSQSFPAFGAERAGAPVVAFVRLSSTPIRVRSQVYTPDVVIVQDETLLGAVDVLQGLKPDGLLIINSKKKAQELALATSAKVLTIPASEIALAVIGRNIPNTTLLGAYAAATGDITEYALIEAIHERFGARGREINAQAVQRAAEYVRGNGAQQVAGGVAFKQKASDRPKWVARHDDGRRRQQVYQNRIMAHLPPCLQARALHWLPDLRHALPGGRCLRYREEAARC